jgi:hypothetical protein
LIKNHCQFNSQLQCVACTVVLGIHTAQHWTTFPAQALQVFMFALIPLAPVKPLVVLTSCELTVSISKDLETERRDSRDRIIGAGNDDHRVAFLNLKK